MKAVVLTGSAGALGQRVLVRLAAHPHVADLTGLELTGAVDQLVPAGSHRAVFDASGHPSGLYLYRVTAGDETRTGRMMLTR